MNTVDEIKVQVETTLQELKAKVRANDPVFNFLAQDPIGDFVFDSKLRMLPFELVEKYGILVLEDESEYKKFADPSYDIFRQEWDKHLLGYWQDRLQLLEEYLKPISSDMTPLQVFNRLSDLMIKIERRAILLRPEPKIVEQKHTRQSGEEKDYLFIRSYWIDENGDKKRMIARHIGERYQRLEKEIADLFHDHGYAVHRSYRSLNGTIYDMVIELAGTKTAVEIKMLNKDIFNHLFLYDELSKRFTDDYKNTA